MHMDSVSEETVYPLGDDTERWHNHFLQCGFRFGREVFIVGTVRMSVKIYVCLDPAAFLLIFSRFLF